MAWKVRRQWEMRLGDDWPIFPELDGKAVRVTVEEEVNECCEKWRGHYSCALADKGCVFAFCPECGRKL